ncbi:Rrf2 family transcriptional regulator [Clostridium sp. CM028]|uniref:RrF2 family transcriptional regulator n=1 Tax=unclassified Clostridium TaxID=2614128 RepID=UPI001C6E3936|nr:MULTISPECIES: Rrf2 family transcriptional regulator [unclassified Clostridium]MBW9145217.1 Rrf2 family transcriptional regulator [Clostridium sp. CM027]MBW9148458.1 Rrf2 family transcriptional regulator [Clostridium sp. CM028]UVE40350.1 Rrf2 family transcriptional regulator [Clostridium sp. CM027]WLC61031.1 Rrf2 family transcriptional regulator [Clostridium sp. CM028]
MQFSIGVEYALHCLLYMVDIPSGKAVGIKDLAAFQGVSESYLSKVYTKLRKSGIVKSIPGVNGGYELARIPESITFWNIVEAEDQMRQFLNNKTLGWLHEQVSNKILEEHGKATIEWFNNSKSR